MDDQLSNDNFWKMFYSAGSPITTNATPPAGFDKLFSEAAEKGYDGVVCILVSAKLSATNRNASMGADVTREKYPGFKIEIVDSNTASGAEGFVVMEAAKAAEAGKSFDEVVKAAEVMKPRVKWLTVMQTLKYLIRCGRAPKAALIGSWLGVRPVIGGVSGEGVVESLGKVRGADKSIQKLVDMVADYIDPQKPIHAFVHYTDDIQLGEMVKQMVAEKYQCEELYLTPYCPVMACSTGPVMSIAFYQ
jgi:DegV family protein with EDD domain